MESDIPSANRLQEATAAIEAAYQRIEQARRSLREIAARNSGTIDPGHRAIVLTNLQPEPQQEQTQTDTTEFDEIVERFISALSERNSARFRRVTSDLRALTATSPAWQSLRQSHSQRRANVLPSPSNEDDGVTMLGRMVASRLPPTTPTMEEANTDHTSEASTPAVPDRPPLGRLHLPPPTTPSGFYPSLLRSNRYSRTDSSGTGTRTSTSSSGRLSLLSNASMYHNFQTPNSSISREQSLLLFDEPATMTAEPDRRRSILIPPEAIEGRNYTLIRRYDERGDEVVAQVSVPNDPLASVSRRPQRTSQNGTNEPSTQQRRRPFTATDTASPLTDNGDYWGPRPYDPVVVTRANLVHDFVFAEEDDVNRAIDFPGFSNFEISKAYDDNGSVETVYIGTSKPYRASPLPLPLPDPTAVKPVPSRPPRAISRQASLAAR